MTSAVSAVPASRSTDRPGTVQTVLSVRAIPITTLLFLFLVLNHIPHARPPAAAKAMAEAETLLGGLLWGPIIIRKRWIMLTPAMQWTP